MPDTVPGSGQKAENGRAMLPVSWASGCSRLEARCPGGYPGVSSALEMSTDRRLLVTVGS